MSHEKISAIAYGRLKERERERVGEALGTLHLTLSSCKCLVSWSVRLILSITHSGQFIAGWKGLTTGACFYPRQQSQVSNHYLRWFSFLDYINLKHLSES